jgi:hypothetical protein
MLEQNGFVQYLKSFDDNKVFKEQIEFANVCSSVHGHSLKIVWTYTGAHEFVKRGWSFYLENDSSLEY